MMNKIVVRIYYPADPAGVIPGGVDTFLRGIISCSPDDIDVELVGATADPVARPVGSWSNCVAGVRGYRFFPVIEAGDVARRSKIPLSLRYTANLFRFPRLLGSREVDILEFHRLEPALVFLGSGVQKNLFVHQNMNVIRNKGSDIIWRHFPVIFDFLQRLLTPRFSSIWCVRQDAVENYKKSYPRIADRFRFVPTWVDTAVFFPLDLNIKTIEKKILEKEFGIDVSGRWITFVGRFDRQKDPLLLIEAFSKAKSKLDDIQLLLVGVGVLEKDMRARVEALGIVDSVHFVGVQPFFRVAQILQCSDLFALASAYEGMPMSALEAIGCGVPVACTDVGELRKVVIDGLSGKICVGRSAQEFSEVLIQCLDGSLKFTPSIIASYVDDFVPQKVLIPVFDNYRVLAGLKGNWPL